MMLGGRYSERGCDCEKVQLSTQDGKTRLVPLKPDYVIERKGLMMDIVGEHDGGTNTPYPLNPGGQYTETKTQQSLHHHCYIPPIQIHPSTDQHPFHHIDRINISKPLYYKSTIYDLHPLPMLDSSTTSQNPQTYPRYSKLKRLRKSSIPHTPATII